MSLVITLRELIIYIRGSAGATGSGILMGAAGSTTAGVVLGASGVFLSTYALTRGVDNYTGNKITGWTTDGMCSVSGRC